MKTIVHDHTKEEGCHHACPAYEAAPVAEPRHTPGPWIARKEERGWSVRLDNQHGSTGQEIARLDTGYAGQVELNARLIAAAPEAARQRDELEVNLRHQCKLNGQASMEIEALEQQRDELLGVLRELLSEIDADTTHLDLRPVRAAIARCQPAEKG